jgi:hypothetical protein
VAHLDAPQALAVGVLRDELGHLRRVDAPLRHREAHRVVLVAVAGDVHAALGALDHDAVRGRNPLALGLVVVGGRDERAGGEAEEVVDVGRDRLREAHVGGARRDRLVDGELDGVGVGAAGRQVAGHRLVALRPDRVLGRAHAEVAERMHGAVGERHRRVGAGLEHQRRLARAVRVGHLVARDGLQRRGVLVDVHHLGRVGRHHDVLDVHVVLPRDVLRALDRGEPRLLDVQHELPAAVDGEVVAAVGARGRVAELGVVEDRHARTAHRDGRAGGVRAGLEHAPAQHGDPLRLDRAGRDVLLDRVGALVEEARAARDARRHGRGRVGRDVGRIAGGRERRLRERVGRRRARSGRRGGGRRRRDGGDRRR